MRFVLKRASRYAFFLFLTNKLQMNNLNFCTHMRGIHFICIYTFVLRARRNKKDESHHHSRTHIYNMCVCKLCLSGLLFARIRDEHLTITHTASKILFLYTRFFISSRRSPLQFANNNEAHMFRNH